MVLRASTFPSWNQIAANGAGSAGRDNGAAGEHLRLDSLDRLCSWLARQWSVVAYGSDCRPASLRGFGVAASAAYENAGLARATEKDKEVPS